MTPSTRDSAAPAGRGGAESGADWMTSMTQGILEAQRLQWDTWTAWQQSLLAFNRDLWEQWACRFGGGVPIDA